MITAERYFSIRAGCFAALLLLFLLGCSYAPVQEMSDARQAIQAAKAANAAQYARDELDSAQALLKRAEGELNDGHYKQARRTAIEAREQAIMARRTAQKAEPVSD